MLLPLAIRLKKLGWNKERFTPEFVQYQIDKEGIELVELDLPVDGIYAEPYGVPTIGIKSGLRGGHLHEVKTHELGHFYYDVPGTYSRGKLHTIEFQVQRFTACALIPKPMLKSRSRWDIQEEYDYTDYVMNFRYILWDEWKE